MGRTFVVHSHRQLCARNGDLVAGGGESVAADHPAVLALTDPHAFGRFVEAPDAAEPEPAPTTKTIDERPRARFERTRNVDED